MKKESANTPEGAKNDLLQSIKELNQLIKYQTSWKYVWARGIVLGVAGAIGASVIAGIILTALSWFFSAADLPSLENVVDEANTTLNQ